MTVAPGIGSVSNLSLRSHSDLSVPPMPMPRIIQQSILPASSTAWINRMREEVNWGWVGLD